MELETRICPTCNQEMSIAKFIRHRTGNVGDTCNACSPEEELDTGHAEVCLRCKVERDISCFTDAEGRVFNTCNRCRKLLTYRMKMQRAARRKPREEAAQKRAPRSRKLGSDAIEKWGSLHFDGFAPFDPLVVPFSTGGLWPIAGIGGVGSAQGSTKRV